jgi:hypothetical protein
MKLTATITRSVEAGIQAELRDIERAVASGTRDAGRGLRTELRRQVTSAGLGQRLANSWRDRHYPNQQLDAATLVYTKAPQIIRAFDEGEVIRELAVRHITSWTGVELEGGPAPPTPENIAAVMELYPVGERFFQEFTPGLDEIRGRLPIIRASSKLSVFFGLYRPRSDRSRHHVKEHHRSSWKLTTPGSLVANLSSASSLHRLLGQAGSR